MAEWQAAAAHLDALERNDLWKNEASSEEYDFELVQSRLAALEDACKSGDPNHMLLLIRTSLARGLGGMGNPSLYRGCWVGTKNLIEEYIQLVLNILSLLLDTTRKRGGSWIDPNHLLQQVLQTRQAFGRSALLLSGGGTFGMSHIGVVKCLHQVNLLPRIVSGASAGSIVCAVLCTKTDDELPSVLEGFCYGDMEVFTRGEEEQKMLHQVARLLKHGNLFDISNLTRVMRSHIGDITFQEAYNRTRRILNVCVSSAGIYELPRLLNYVTAPNVIIWSAV